MFQQDSNIVPLRPNSEAPASRDEPLPPREWPLVTANLIRMYRELHKFERMEISEESARPYAELSSEIGHCIGQFDSVWKCELHPRVKFSGMRELSGTFGGVKVEISVLSDRKVAATLHDSEERLTVFFCNPKTDTADLFMSECNVRQLWDAVKAVSDAFTALSVTERKKTVG